MESWRGASDGAPLSNNPSRQKAWGLPIVKKNWDNMLREADQVSRARLLAIAQKEIGAWAQCFAGFVAWDTTGLRELLTLPLPLEWALMFVFHILASAAGGWTVEVCMVCPANTVLATFQGIRQ